jgi:Domain of unknown function (DUF5979)
MRGRRSSPAVQPHDYPVHSERPGGVGPRAVHRDLEPRRRSGHRDRRGHVPGSVCIVVETADGHSTTVTATVTGNAHKATVGAGEEVPVHIADLYADTPGSLTVTKTIAGEAAGKQGPVAILVACGEPAVDFAFLIPAGAAAGSVKRSFDGIPAGSKCIVTETADGSTNTVSAVVLGSGAQATVPTAGTATAELTDTHSTRPVPIAPVSPVVPSVAVTG